MSRRRTAFDGTRAIATLKLKLQVLRGGDIAMGPGKAALIEAIDAHGSISAAARAMGMSYRRAWLLVDTLNRCFAKALIETVPGGGSRVNADGMALVAAYRRLVERAAPLAQDADYLLLSGAMRD